MNEANQLNSDFLSTDNLDDDEDESQQTNNNKTLDKAIARITQLAAARGVCV